MAELKAYRRDLERAIAFFGRQVPVRRSDTHQGRWPTDRRRNPCYGRRHYSHDLLRPLQTDGNEYLYPYLVTKARQTHRILKT